MVLTERLLAAIEALPVSSTEAELLQAVVRSICTELGWSAARITGPDGVVVQWPRECPAEVADSWLLSSHLVLEVGGAGDAEGAEVLAVVAGKLLDEARSRARLTQRVEQLASRAREAEERHRSLTLRMAELRGELDTTQQRHVVLSERNRIAQDLHDRAAQTNFLLALKLDWALAHLAPDDPMRAEMERLKELAAQAAAQTREAIYALRASEMAEGGLQGGLRRLVRSMEADGFTASLTVTGIPVTLPHEVEDALFKLAQEALNNARKHSRGSAVIVALRFSHTAVTLVVQDDGVGLPEGASAEMPGHLGLKGMRERVAALGGELHLMSGDEGGLIVRATIPLEGVESRGDSDRHRG
jgi:signal transduction histidine kinase